MAATRNVLVAGNAQLSCPAICYERSQTHILDWWRGNMAKAAIIAELDHKPWSLVLWHVTSLATQLCLVGFLDGYVAAGRIFFLAGKGNKGRRIRALFRRRSEIYRPILPTAKKSLSYIKLSAVMKRKLVMVADGSVSLMSWKFNSTRFACSPLIHCLTDLISYPKD